jgi:hypothetical protein
MDLECTHVDDGFFGEGIMIEAGFCIRACADHCAGLVRDLKIAGDEICVEVGVEDMRQLNPVLMAGSEEAAGAPDGRRMR